MKRIILAFAIAAFLCFSGQALGGEPRFFGQNIFNVPLTFNYDVTFGAATHLVLPSHNDAATPTLAFGDGDTGFYEASDDTLCFASVGVRRWVFSGAFLFSDVATGALILNETTTATNPVHSFKDDEDTGIGAAAADQLSLIAGGVEGIRISEAGTTETEITGRLVMSDSVLTVTTEVDITDPLASSVLLITGDNDADNDAIDLQNGETAGQILYIIAVALVDVDDTITIAMTDTTCTNCPAIVFDKIGENATLVWTGITWVVTGLQTSL